MVSDRSFDIFQFAVNEGLASLLPVEGNAEAMGFVADVAHHFERVRPCGSSSRASDPRGRKSPRSAWPGLRWGLVFSIPSSHSTA